jgi:cell division protein FtsL
MSTPMQSRIRVQRIAEEAVERARLRVVPRSRVRAPKVPFVMLVSMILLAGVVGLLMFNTTMQQNSFTAEDLQAQAADLRSQEQALQADLDELANPQRIGEAAMRMGMVVPVCPRFLYIATDKVTPTCGEPSQPFDVRAPAARRPESLVPQRTVVKLTRAEVAAQALAQQQAQQKAQATQKTTTQNTGDTPSGQTGTTGTARSNGVPAN